MTKSQSEEELPHTIWQELETWGKSFAPWQKLVDKI
jgi:hypothetical protein